MDTRISAGLSRQDVVSTETATRVTPPSGVPFKDMVNRGAGAILRGAEAAINSLPGAPIVAAAVRPGGGTVPSPIGSTGGAAGAAGAAGFTASRMTGVASSAAEGPGAAVSGTGAENSSVEGALAQSQEFNLYYLQLQEQMSAESRSYSAISNVLKARHDTMKNAIGNIR